MIFNCILRPDPRGVRTVSNARARVIVKIQFQEQQKNKVKEQKKNVSLRTAHLIIIKKKKKAAKLFSLFIYLLTCGRDDYY